MCSRLHDKPASSEDLAMTGILHTVASVGSSRGGPSRTVPALCRMLARPDPENVVLVTSHGLGSDVPDWDAGDVLWSCWRVVPARSLVPLISRMASVFAGRGGLVVHDHGVWLPGNIAAVLAARIAGCKVIVSPRGMLEPWSIQHRWFKKKLAWIVYQRPVLQLVDGIHATSREEAQSLVQLGLKAPIAVIPNGVQYPVHGAPALCVERVVLFVGRVNVKKGLVLLLHAWARARQGDWRLRIVGPDEDGHRAELEALSRQLDISESVDFQGEVGDAEKWRYMEQSGVVILPSYSENFGVVVAEALAAGVPVIATHGTPWSGLVTRGCGWWVDATVDSLADALRSSQLLDPAARREMGRRGADWARSEFSWEGISRSMSMFYQWIQRGGIRSEAPDFVITESGGPGGGGDESR
jgi:glycosyltransferase involved in cell wall biosynthesis